MWISLWGLVALLCSNLVGIQPAHAQSSPVTGPLNNATSLPVGSCTPEILCSNGACCNGISGFCGFGPAFCTPVASGGNCTSNCDAKAECGPYAPPENLTCPLNVCCSQYGFCGTTTDFCSTGCLSNCGSPIPPVCGSDTDSALTRRVGYYNGAAASRGCMAYPPEQIYTVDLTHVNFAFGYISDSFQVVEANPGDSQLWQRTTDLKAEDPTLRVFLSIGGWDFNDPPTSTIFSQLVASTANTNTFIVSVLLVMETYAFDGIDIDWEYPGAYDRGGGPTDTENYVIFMAAVKSAFAARGYGLSFTAPSSYWYLQHFDLPGLLKSADWVNVMTYDLHGVWDGTDPYVGYVLDAHTNLTEIDQAFDLYWRAGVQPPQINMGFAFYGRTFTLASSACWDPGCAWVSGGNPGPCSATAGVLMFSEIGTIMNQSGGGQSAQSVVDPVAAVNYMEWDSNQWVSFDTAETFGMKINYANDHCIGGSIIWSVDQDDSSYTALSGLYGNVTQGIASGVSQSTGCLYSDWGNESCPDGFSFVGKEVNPDNAQRWICCESGNAPSPQSCAWIAPVDNPTCAPVCPPDTILLDTTTVGCMSGSMPFCCQTNMTAIENCYVGVCSANPTCTDPTAQILVTSVVNGQPADCSGIASQCSLPCAAGESRPFCCEANDFPYENCKWVGTPPLCLDSACPIGQITLISDFQGDATEPCVGSGTRSYCCDPIGSAFVPVPFYDVFFSNITEGAQTFDVEFDPTTENNGAGISFGDGATTENENTEAFGEIFIDSPNPQSVSSVAAVSDWVITSCHSTSDQPQTVLAYCSKPMGSSGCAHVFIGGAEHTIVQMPSSCGLGPYARVASLTPHVDQSILSAFHQAKKPANELVYSFSFDYEFSLIPESNGPVYMRADVTDMPGYWDSVVDSPPSRKRWLEEQERKKGFVRRWWGTFTTWLSKLTTIRKSELVSRTFAWEDTYTIYQNSLACPSGSFQASLDIDVSGNIDMTSSFGFYLEATVVPPSVQAAYLSFNADAGAAAQFQITGQALVQYNSQNIQFASFGFPGLYYPGLLTVGPSLAINGYATGELSIQGELYIGASIEFPPVNIQLGAVGDSFIGTPVIPVNPLEYATKPTFGTQLAIAGDLSLHLVPALQLGINVLNGVLVDAQAYIQSDLYGGITVDGSAGVGLIPMVCYNMYYGIDFYGGLTGSLLYWESTSVAWPFYQTKITLSEDCTTGPSTKRDTSNPSLPEPLYRRTVPPALDERYPAYILERKGSQERYIYPVNDPLTVDAPSVDMGHLMKRATIVPQLPCIFNCPGTDGLTASGDNIWGDLSTSLDAQSKRRWAMDEAIGVNQLEGKDDEPDSFDEWDVMPFLVSDDDDVDEIEPRSILHPEELANRVTVPNCRDITFAPLTYSNAVENVYWDLFSPRSLSKLPVYSGDSEKSPVSGTYTYGREHIYEVHLVAAFIGYLRGLPTQWDGTNFCAWVQSEVVDGTILPELLDCLPHNAGDDNAYMPWLEAWANSIKYRAFSGKTLFTNKTFNGYPKSKQVYVMRAIAGLTDYLTNKVVINSFLQQSKCIRCVWEKHIPTVGPYYDSWIKSKVAVANAQIGKGIQALIKYWNAAQGGDTVEVNVALDWGDNLQDEPEVTPDTVTGEQLQRYLVNYALNQPLSWVDRLAKDTQCPAI